MLTEDRKDTSLLTEDRKDILPKIGKKQRDGLCTTCTHLHAVVPVMRAALLLCGLALARAPARIASWLPTPARASSSDAGDSGSVLPAVATGCAIVVGAAAAWGTKKRHFSGTSSAGTSGAGASSSFYSPPSWERDTQQDAHVHAAHDESVGGGSEEEEEVFCQSVHGGSDGFGDDKSDASSCEVHSSDMDDDIDDEAAKDAGTSSSAGKLWTAQAFPEGTKGAANWDLRNLSMAQDWQCPCSDRNCLSRDRYPRVDPLYDFRKGFQTKSKGLRDTFRQDILEPLYSTSTRTFSRAVRIGERNDCCVESAGLAAGLSFGTFANARADVRLTRPTRSGRVDKKEKLVSKERQHLEAYIRNLRGTMEGTKGGDDPDTWFTGKRSMALRWEDYRKERIAQSLPIIGSSALFTKIWHIHAEIIQQGSCGHAVCADCGGFESRRDKIEGRHDAAAKAERQQLAAEEAAHQVEHSGERKYAEDFWYRGETCPSQVTCMRIDAPTQHQFDLPRQRKIARDVVKSVDGNARWSSKITGVQVAGVGMYAFVARAALGSGPNVVMTAMLLTLQAMFQAGDVLGACLMLILDNTAGENKCNAVIVTLAWVVHMGWFREAGFFCQLVGHTYNELDQSFNSLIASMLQYAVYTVAHMISLIYRFLGKYGVREVVELEHLYDVSGVLLPCANKLGGFCTGQHGDGMHEIRIRKDADGVVRLKMRKSSKSSGWLPEGPGYEVFHTTPPSPRELLPALFKPDAQWKRSTVQSTIRAWIPFMTLSKQGVEDCMKEWDKYFSLPPNMQPSQLPSLGRSLLPTVYLPSRDWTDTSGGTQAEDVTNPSVRLENPVVDPTFNGTTRTTADVQRETQRFRAEIRGNVQPGQCFPVFQGDYLLVQMPGVALALHQVNNGVMLHASQERDLQFTTVEYFHTPQDGIQGFWGTFEKKPNPNYDPKNVKSGTKFVRHDNITRDMIVLHDVQTWMDTSVDPKRLRVQQRSLEVLSRSHPNDFAMPSPVPPSHAQPTQQQPRQQAEAGAPRRRQQAEAGAPRRRRRAPARPAAGGAAEEGGEASGGAAEEGGDASGGAAQEREGEEQEGEEQEGVEQEGEGQESEAEEPEAVAAAAAAAALAAAARDRTGHVLEVQGCDSECDFVCGECEWESCCVLADHGNSCTVRIVSDDTECTVANRYLRVLAAVQAKRSRQR